MTNDQLDTDARPSLRDDARSRARARIVAGARVAVARSGLSATTDEVAAEAGVSRRTVFRHFATHDDLIVEVIRETGRAVADLMPATPLPGADLHAWLANAMIQLHSFVRTFVGRAFWDVYSGTVELSAEAREELAKILERRRLLADGIASSAWRAMGGTGDPPSWVRAAFIIHASGFATFALPEVTVEETGELSARVLLAALAAALEDESVAGGPARGSD